MIEDALEQERLRSRARKSQAPSRSTRWYFLEFSLVILAPNVPAKLVDRQGGKTLAIGKLGATEITLCDLALREGLVLDYIHRHRKEIARVDRYPDVRRRSAMELAERCNWEADHAKQVARMAVSIFEQTRHLHELGEKEQEWLEYASLLHDVGTHISYERHHRHSYYLINGDLRGFEPDEIEVIALVSRYHRRGKPKRGHDGYGDLPAELKRTVRVLGAILRVAESLDRSRHGVVSALSIKDRGADLRLQLEARGDAELEVWAGRRQLAVLEAELGKPIVVTKVDASLLRAPPRAAPADPAGHQQLSRRCGIRGRPPRPWAATCLKGGIALKNQGRQEAMRRFGWVVLVIGHRWLSPGKWAGAGPRVPDTRGLRADRSDAGAVGRSPRPDGT